LDWKTLADNEVRVLDAFQAKVIVAGLPSAVTQAMSLPRISPAAEIAAAAKTAAPDAAPAARVKHLGVHAAVRGVKICCGEMAWLTPQRATQRRIRDGNRCGCSHQVSMASL